MDTQRRIALVTGAALGIGRATANHLARLGYTVLVTDVDHQRCQQAAAEIASAGGSAIPFRLDVTDEQGWSGLAMRVTQDFGRLDVLVNNAGILIIRDIEASLYADWDRLRRVNLDSMHLGTTQFMPLLERSAAGTIVNLSSTDAVKGSAWAPIYSATKGMIRRYSELVATECVRRQNRVRVYSVLPGPIETPLMNNSAQQVMPGRGPLKAALRATMLTATKRRIRTDVPRGRLGVAADIAQGIAFLTTGRHALANGAALVIDGGFSSA